MTIPTHLDHPVFGGRYRVVRRVAEGGMGDVWRAKDEVLGRWVAIKVLRSQFSDSRGFRDRFRVEARAAAALAHPKIATVYDYGEEIDSGGLPRAYIVMEFVDGESLEARLRTVGQLSPEVTADVIGQAAEALHEAHSHGIVHRDVKPGNLMLRPDGVVKLTDFGIARIPGGAAMTEVGVMLGTVQYMAPELVSGAGATPASDIYALGVVAYACVTGHPPFSSEQAVAVAVAHQHEDVPPLPDRIPVALRELIEQMLDKDPRRRPPSAGEIAVRARSGGTGAKPAGDRLPAPSATTAIAAPQRMDDSYDRTVGSASVPGAAAEVPTQTSSPKTDLLSIPPSDIRQHTRGRSVKRVSAVAVIAVVLGGVALVLSSALAPTTVTMPDLKGVPTNAAVARLGHLGLHARWRTIDGTAPTGTVVSQSPRPGSRLSSGTTVELTEGSGYVDLNPATLTGQAAPAVFGAIASLGLTPQEVVSASSEPPGTVLAITPSGRLRLGTAVDVTVATTPPPPSTTEPTTPASQPSPPHAKSGKKDNSGPGH